MSETSQDFFKVVVNDEEQYSILPLDRALPAGWVEAGKSGPKEECLSYIRETWTDMRPRSLRRPESDSQ